MRDISVKMPSENVTDIRYKIDTKKFQRSRIHFWAKKAEAYRYSYPCYSDFTSVKSSFLLSDVDFDVWFKDNWRY